MSVRYAGAAALASKRAATKARHLGRQPRLVDKDQVGGVQIELAGAILALDMAASLTFDAFLSERNFVDVVRQAVTNGFLALGMLIVVRTGGIDLTVGSTLAIAGMLAAGL